MNSVTSAVDGIRKTLTPPKFLSWQTLLLVSGVFWALILFDYYASGPNPQFDENLILNLAWIFLLAGLAWWQFEQPLKLSTVSLGPWIISALICILLFVRPSGEVWPGAWILWPLLAVAITVVPDLLTPNRRLKVPQLTERWKAIVTALSGVLLSCWLGFFLVVQGWIADYPDLISADVSRSNFVVRLGEPGNSNGHLLLNQVENLVRQEVNGKTWGSIERFLLTVQLGKVNVKEYAMRKLTKFPNRDRWIAWIEIVKGAPSNVKGTAYDLKLHTHKQEWGDRKVGYGLIRRCSIRQASIKQQNKAEFIPTGTLSCDSDNEFTFEPTPARPAK
jgi:Family of unknown function (DUF5357)